MTTLTRLAFPGSLETQAAQALPQTATATLFTVSDGAVLVQFMYGIVTTALGGVVTSLSLGHTPTGGANAPASISPLAVVTSKVLGSLYVPAFTSGIAAAPLQANVVGFNTPFVPFIVTPGVITWTANANNTGEMAWYLWWAPISPGAALVAA